MDKNKKETLAFQLIDMMGWSLRKLYGGTLPDVWKERIRQACDMTKVGALVRPENRKRDIEIATKAMAHKIAAKQWKKEGKEHISYTRFVGQLCQEFGFQNVDTAFDIIKKYENEAALNIRLALKVFSDVSTEHSATNKETPDEDLVDLSRAIKISKPDIEKIFEWVRYGESLQLFETETDFQENFIKTFISKSGGDN